MKMDGMKMDRMIRRAENDKWVQDHQTEMGCYILPESKMDGD